MCRHVPKVPNGSYAPDCNGRGGFRGGQGARPPFMGKKWLLK